MITEIRNEIIADATLSPIIGTRVYYRNPIDNQTAPYISFIRSNLDRNDVQQSDFFQFTCFSSDMSEIETMTNAIITLFEDNTMIDTKPISQSEFIAATDGISKITTTGFFFNIITFKFIYSS